MTKPPVPAGDTEGLRRRIAELEALLEQERAAARDLTKNADRHDQLVAVLPDAIIVQRNGKIVFANIVAAALHGAEAADQLVGRKTLDFVHPEDHGRILARRAQTSDGPRLESLEHRRLRVDGSGFMAKTRSAEISWNNEPATLIVVRDSTRREKVRKELRESESRYRDLIEGSTFGIQISRTNGTRLFVNTKYVAMFGFDSAQEVLAITRPGIMVAPHDRERMIANRMARAKGEAAPETYEYDALRKDGSIMPVQVFIRNLTWEGDAAIQRTFLDITARREAEQAERESEERYRQLAEASPEGIFVHTDDVIVFANRSLAKILGAATPDELIGTRALDVVPPGQREEVLARRLMVRAGKSVELLEGKYLRRDGTEIHVERVMTQITWQGRQSFLILVRDINDRKKAQAALRESEQRYRSLVEFIPEPLLVTDRGKVLFCNPAAVRLFGAESQEQLIGINHLDMVHPEDRPLLLPRMKENSVLAPVSSMLELRRFRLDGTEFISESFSAPFVWDGEGVRIAIIRDITERKKIEAERERMVENLLEAQRRIEEQTDELREMAGKSDQAMREAQAANQAKSEFLALMSHELRTPLNAVLGFSEIISRETFGPLGSVKYGEYAQDIYDSGQHLLDLINDILDLSKVESGKDEIYEEDIRIDGLLGQLMSLVKGRAERGQVALEQDCPEDIQALYADRRKVKQILVNLLSNAIKFTPEGGRVTLRIWCRPESGHVFQIIDSGIGIALEDIPKALAPFRQVESELNRTVEGTGLGLPLSKALVELHSGSLDLQSEVGAGTTVTVRFPAERVVSEQSSDAWEGRQSA